MQLNFLETHDRFQSFIKQDFKIGECCQELINQKPFGNHSFYIFVHPRTDENKADKRLLWQTRLTKPSAETNSMLFKAYPGRDLIKIIWIIPDRNLWKQYKKGLMVENQIIVESIRAYEKDRASLEAPESDDLSDKEIAAIYTDMINAAKFDDMMKKTFETTPQQENSPSN